jgi:hypothetical protein
MIGVLARVHAVW